MLTPQNSPCHAGMRHVTSKPLKERRRTPTLVVKDAINPVKKIEEQVFNWLSRYSVLVREDIIKPRY